MRQLVLWQCMHLTASAGADTCLVRTLWPSDKTCAETYVCLAEQAAASKLGHGKTYCGVFH